MKNAIKWWVIGATLFNLFTLLISLPVVGFHDYLRVLREVVVYVVAGFYLFFGLMTFSMTRQWMPFVRLAEKVFTTLGWPSPGNVDLVKSTKAQRKPDDPGELGTFYFRY